MNFLSALDADAPIWNLYIWREKKTLDINCTHKHSPSLFLSLSSFSYFSITILCTVFCLATLSFFSPVSCVVVGAALQNLENIFTDQDHNHHHYRLHHPKMMIIKISDVHEHNRSAHWHQLYQMIKIYRAGCPKTTSKRYCFVSTNKRLEHFVLSNIYNKNLIIPFLFP